MCLAAAQGIIARLQASLTAVEAYAVRLIESGQPVDVEAVAQQQVEALRQEDYNIDAIERRKEQQVGTCIWLVRLVCLFALVVNCYSLPDVDGSLVCTAVKIATAHTQERGTWHYDGWRHL